MVSSLTCSRFGRAVLIMTVLMLCSFPINAEIYKWIDKYGKTQFTDNPPIDKKTEEVKVKINTYSAVTIKPLTERLGRKDKVVMYSATWCGICKQAKKYFTKNDIPYVVYDVEHSRVGKMDFKLLRGRSVPIIIVGKQRMNGFTVSRFDRLYKKFKANQEIKQSI